MFASNTSQVSSDATYIEDVFSTYLYTGNGSTQTITNGIDLSGKGGLTWIKKRNAAEDHILTDTVRGAGNTLFSNLTSANEYDITRLSAFTSSGFSVGTSFRVNQSSNTYASWTFRKQPKFFDVVTYTGNGVAGRTVAHNLGSTPGCIIVKATSAANDWLVYHTSLGNTQGMSISSTSAAATSTTYWNNTSPTSTQFTVGTSPRSNENGTTFVAYLFAHNAGGFGLTGTDNVISCGSYTGNGGTTTPNQINIGFEPQWLLIKASSTTSNWAMGDLMRGMYTESGGTAKYRELLANTSGAEGGSDGPAPTATGFAVSGTGLPNASGVTYIYIAIRRGPMKTPTTGTSVFTPAVSAGATGTKITTDFPLDLQFSHSRSSADIWWWADRLRGMNSPGLSSNSPYLSSNNTNAEATSPGVTNAWDNTSFSLGSAFSGQAQVYYNLRRAPGFFDEVCYTGTGANRTVTHNLGVAPEMMIFKRRDTTANWRVYHSSQPASDLGTLNSNIYFQTDTNVLNSTAPTASVFTVGTNAQTNASGGTYVAYLFATVAGVSKVGSYTGTGTTKQIDCGFTSGARFVLIKRVDDNGDWYVWDTARGIVSGNDPYLLLNSTAAEVTSTDYIDPVSSGFEISSTAPAAINASGGTFIYLAIA